MVGLDGGDEKLALGELGAKFEDAARGVSGRNGPSSAVAGDSGLLPGIVARLDLVTGGVDCELGLTSRPRPDVSQWPKELSTDTASLDVYSKDDLAESLVKDVECTSLVREVAGPLLPPD